MPVTVAIDAMGGDHGPSTTLSAALKFLEATPDARVIAVGLEAPMHAALAKLHSPARDRVTLHSATEVVEMHEPPADALRRARLDDRGNDVVSGFSRGMRQRLALERALLHSPRLLLLDEAFTGLDDASTMAPVVRLKELKSAGCIMLVATHDLDVGEAVLDRALILHDGRLIASEPDVRGLRRRYQDRLQTGAPPS